jgi:hypothetical protein
VAVCEKYSLKLLVLLALPAEVPPVIISRPVVVMVELPPCAGSSKIRLLLFGDVGAAGRAGVVDLEKVVVGDVALPSELEFVEIDNEVVGEVAAADCAGIV